MSRIPDVPALTSSFCFNQTALQDFLRISRGAVDDTISQNLNALLTPSDRPFDPQSTSTRQPRPIGRRSIDNRTCDEFKRKILFPSWQVRSDVLHYCAGVATSPDPDDPQNLLRQVEDAKARAKEVNERLDPYSGRYFPRETRTEALASLLRNESMVEDIIRKKTWETIGERCKNEATDHEQALQAWRTSRA